MNRYRLYKIILATVLIVFLASLSGCVIKDRSSSAQIFSLDTVIDITAYGDNCDGSVEAAKAEIYRLEKLLSVTDEDSDIYRINTADGKSVQVSSETYELIERAVEISELTDGNFDITVYSVLKLWGFTTGEYRVPADNEIAEALFTVSSDKISLLGNNTVAVEKGTELDLGAIAKGYIADKAAEAMAQAGAQYGLVSLGGNVRTIGTKPQEEKWSIGIRHPEENGYFATVNSEEVSVITSGAYQRNFTEDGVTYHHIIDPDSGKPSESDAVSVTVIGKDGTLCDALSTAIFIGGTEYAERLQNEYGNFEYVILAKDSSVYASDGLKENLSLAKGYENINIIYK